MRAILDPHIPQHYIQRKTLPHKTNYAQRLFCHQIRRQQTHPPSHLHHTPFPLFTIPLTPLLRHTDLFRDRTRSRMITLASPSTLHNIPFTTKPQPTSPTFCHHNQHHLTLCYAAALGPAPFWHDAWPHHKKQLLKPWSSSLRFIKPPATTKAGFRNCAKNRHNFAGARTHFPQYSCHMLTCAILCCSFSYSTRVTCIIGEENSYPYTKSCRNHRLELPENL